MEATAVAVGVERATALDMVDVARALAARDRSWNSETFAFADGQAVLFGPGLYVNRAMAAGLEADVTDAQLDLLKERSRAVGVQPAFEVSEYTLAPVVARLADRGFRAGNATTVMVRAIDGDLPDPDPSVHVEVVGNATLAAWQEASADGWGHIDAAARRASDAFALAAADAQSPGLLLARSAHDGMVLGCASLSFRDGLAMLGGMSTLPAERGRGVQRALIAYRLGLAADTGCRLAATQVDPAGGSQRNLARLGFVRSHTNTTWTP